MWFSTLFLFSCIVVIGTNSVEENNGDGSKLRIIGGQESKTDYKFMISLQKYGRKRNRFGLGAAPAAYHHICGGSIVGRNCIVTAAHCVENSTFDSLSVLAGTNNLDDEFGDRYFLQNYTIHYKYAALTESDIAIIRLNESIKLSKRVGPIEQSKEYVGEHVKLLLLGWGHTNPTKMITQPPRKLRELNTTSISNAECNKRYAVQASDTDLCTYERMGKGACNGDSGGPLILYRNNIAILVAIVSRGFMVCSMYGIPDVFTRASAYVDWISQECGNNISSGEAN